MPVTWNAAVMLSTLTVTPGSVECKKLYAGVHTLLKTVFVREESRTTSGDPANCVHTTMFPAALMAQSRRASAWSDPKKSDPLGVEKEETAYCTSDGLIVPNTATSSEGRDDRDW